MQAGLGAAAPLLLFEGSQWHPPQPSICRILQGLENAPHSIIGGALSRARLAERGWGDHGHGPLRVTRETGLDRDFLPLNGSWGGGMAGQVRLVRPIIPE